MNNTKYNIGYYNPSESCVFKRNKDEFGGLSNMSTEYPLLINNQLIRSSEALYQALKFSSFPEIQQKILNQKSPMTVKMVSRGSNKLTREDWEEIKVDIMRWCLRVKLAQNFLKFGLLLESTYPKYIVEKSDKDNFWGAKLNSEGEYEGRNILGRLLKELREIYLSEKRYSLLIVKPLKIPNFYLLGKPIETINEIYNFTQKELFSKMSMILNDEFLEYNSQQNNKGPLDFKENSKTKKVHKKKRTKRKKEEPNLFNTDSEKK